MSAAASPSPWTTIVGLEIHAELLTASKMFSACPVVDSVAAPPNSAVDPLSLGLPGTLPVVNARAVDYGLMVGLALNCTIPPVSQFARKSYFYPDLPKGYQISQYDRPLAVDGYVDITLDDGRSKRIRVRRAHLEEDTGKLIHASGGGSLVDYNRAGVPLLEIVTEPDIRTAEEAEAYARKLRAILRYLGVNDGDMSKGVLRFEANVSVMHADDTGFRERTEVKNLNSIRSLYRAIEYETARQVALYERGGTVTPATMGWDEQRQATVVQRVKERADEYRYFPEPDLPLLEVGAAQVEAVRASLPELPDAKRARFVAMGLSDYDAGVLVSEKAIADFFEATLAAGASAKSTVNWMTGTLFTLMNRDSVEREAIGTSRLTPAAFARLVALADDDTLNKGSAAKVLTMMWDTGDAPDDVVAREGLAQVSDVGAIEAAVEAVLAHESNMVAGYFSGKDKLFGALMGKAMSHLGGKGNPALVRDVLERVLTARRPA